MWGQGVYGAQILVWVHKFTFKVVLGVIFSHRLSLLLNIQIKKSLIRVSFEYSNTREWQYKKQVTNTKEWHFDPQFLKLALPLPPNNFVECELPFPRGLKSRTHKGYWVVNHAVMKMCADRDKWSRRIRRYNNSPPYVTGNMAAAP